MEHSINCTNPRPSPTPHRVEPVTLNRWVQRFTPILVEAAKPCRHMVGSSWFVDETYVKVSGSWRYVYRALDQYGQVIDVFVSKKRDLKAATSFFSNAIRSHGEPVEVTTDRAHTLIRVVMDLLPTALHDTTQYANNRVGADHGRLKARLRPMRGLKRDRTCACRILVRPGHATSRYSWISPPRTSLRRSFIGSGWSIGYDRLSTLSGPRWPRERCGRWSL